MKLKKLLFCRASAFLLVLLGGSLASEAHEPSHPINAALTPNSSRKYVAKSAVSLNESLDKLLKLNTAFATISGKVVDTQGGGLPGISIKVERTGASAQTDGKGKVRKNILFFIRQLIH